MATIKTGNVWMQFYRTPDRTDLPEGIERIAMFNTWTSRRLTCSMTAIDSEHYPERIARWSTTSS